MNELRQDPVSKDWIIMSPGRVDRPKTLVVKKNKRKFSSKNNCPFEDLKETGNWPPILSYPDEKKWQIVIIPNKYPALVHHQACINIHNKGPYQLTAGIGHHDLIITRDHQKNLADLSPGEATQLFLLLQKRYRVLASDRCLVYTSTFFNWGARAGASIDHPHYQVLTLPIIPPDIQHSLAGSESYFKKNRRCVHCDIVKYEIKKRVRVVAENGLAIAVAPFVSRQPFEIRIFPKRHEPFFEKTGKNDLKAFVSILRTVLKKIKVKLNDPDLNFFIHTSPLKNQDRYRHYHWHVEVIPKITTLAGFELSTGVEINVVDPDQAAAILKK